MRLRVFCSAATVALLLICALSGQADLPGQKADFTFSAKDGSVDVMREGKVVASYVYKDTTRPYFFPLYGPNGENYTRAYPMKDVAGEPRDHPHHRSFWIGFGDVNGVDFWADGEKSGKIVQTSIDFLPPSPGYWSIHTKNDWIGPDGKKMLEDERYVTFLSSDHGTVISTLLTLTASETKLKFGDNKEGFFALRVAPGMQLKDGTGAILNSAGLNNEAAWGQRAAWCDYTGQINGKTSGITIFDSPWNYGYPTYWHVRDYGLFAANPFGGEMFSSKPENNSALEIPYYGTAQFLYGVLLHDGKLDAETLNDAAGAIVGRGGDAGPNFYGDEARPVSEGNPPQPAKPPAPEPESK